MITFCERLSECIDMTLYSTYFRIKVIRYQSTDVSLVGVSLDWERCKGVFVEQDNSRDVERRLRCIASRHSSPDPI